MRDGRLCATVLVQEATPNQTHDHNDAYLYASSVYNNKRIESTIQDSLVDLA